MSRAGGNPDITKYGLQTRTEHERKAIARRAVESKAKKKYEKMKLQNQLAAVLDGRVDDKKGRKILTDLGFESASTQTNGALLMAVLYRMGISGDVKAIRQIVSMIGSLDRYHETGSVQNDVQINLIQSGEKFEMTEAQEQEIKAALSNDEDDFFDEWEDDV